MRDNQGNKKVVFATGDCTGHGVPGAFMSMAGANLLAQIVNDRKISDPAFILDLLHAGIKSLLQQDQNEIEMAWIFPLVQSIGITKRWNMQAQNVRFITSKMAK